MTTYPSMVLDDGTYYILPAGENPPANSEVLPFYYSFQAETLLADLSADQIHLEILREILGNIDPSYQAQSFSRDDLIFALADSAVSGVIMIAHDEEITYGVSTTSYTEEETSPEEASSSESQSVPSCSADSISIKCGHSDRNYQLKVEKDQVPDSDTIQVISGATTNTADEMEIDVKGSCGEGLSNCPRLVVTGNGVNEEQTGPLKVKLLSREGSYPKEDFVDFFKKIIVPNSFTPQVYEVKARGCGGNEHYKAKIEAVPKAGWSGTVSLGYSHDTWKNSYKRLKKKGGMQLSGSIKATYNEREWTLGGEAGSSPGKPGSAVTKGLFDGAQKVLDTLCPLLGEIKSRHASVSVKWPKLSVGGGITAEEKAGSHEVGLSGNIKVEFSPLIGATIKVDILNIIIDVAATSTTGPAGPALSKFLKKLRGWMEEEIDENASAGVQGKIGIDFITDAEISGPVEWTKKEGSGWDCSGGITGKIGLVLKGYASVEVKAFIVSAGAGAEMGAKSEFGATLEAKSENDDISAYGKLFFSGITLYYNYYYGVNGEGTTNDTASAPSLKGNLEDKFENNFVLVDKAEVRWPDSSAKLAL